jgi:hypothetical protein
MSKLNSSPSPNASAPGDRCRFLQEWKVEAPVRAGENRLHAVVCAGEMYLPAAQEAIATDWTLAYKQYVGRLRTKD